MIIVKIIKLMLLDACELYRCSPGINIQAQRAYFINVNDVF